MSIKEKFSIKKKLSACRQSMRETFYSIYPHYSNCCVRNRNIKVFVSSWIEHYRATSYETKEPETLDWISVELSNDDVLFDIGANIGLYSLYASSLKPACRIFSFEPEAQNFSHLCQNINKNNFKNIVPCNIALSDKYKFDYLHISDMTVGSAFHSLNTPSHFRGLGVSSVFRQGVLSTSIDSLIESGMACPTLLKIDVDGYEEKILKGAQQTLKSGKIRSLLVEVNGENILDGFIVNFLKGNGYIIANQGNPTVDQQEKEISRNIIFNYSSFKS